MNTHTGYSTPTILSLPLSLPRIQDAYPSPLPSPPSSTITRPKFTSDSTIIFHGFAEWLRSFRIHGISARSLVAANHDFRSEILKGIACFSLFFLLVGIRVWDACLIEEDGREVSLIEDKYSIPGQISISIHFRVRCFVQPDVRGTNKKLG